MANPPVCRIMDYGKFKFDEAQRAKESRRKASNVGIKEMKYRPKIGPGDFDTKTRQVAKFLDEGHKVKITIMFRGREVVPPRARASGSSTASPRRLATRPRSRSSPARRPQHDHGARHPTSGPRQSAAARASRSARRAADEPAAEARGRTAVARRQAHQGKA